MKIIFVFLVIGILVSDVFSQEAKAPTMIKSVSPPVSSATQAKLQSPPPPPPASIKPAGPALNSPSTSASKPASQPVAAPRPASPSLNSKIAPALSKVPSTAPKPAKG